ncbi:MAG: hypothetical protein IH944_10065 [Armatimonadetes bacterium]|nr:hypothetical protein [Armatimonadota bacterium]
MESRFQAAVVDFLDACQKCRIEPIIGGSVASSIWGEPRVTNDIDFMVRISDNGVCLVSELQNRFVIESNAVTEAKSDESWPRSFQAIHEESVFKVDVFLIDDSPFARWETEAAKRLEIFDGVFARVLAPEAIALEKLRWYELSNRVSDRQWNDVVKLIETQGEEFGTQDFLQWAKELGLAELAREALAEVGGHANRS